MLMSAGKTNWESPGSKPMTTGANSNNEEMMAMLDFLASKASANNQGLNITVDPSLANSASESARKNLALMDSLRNGSGSLMSPHGAAGDASNLPSALSPAANIPSPTNILSGSFANQIRSFDNTLCATPMNSLNMSNLVQNMLISPKNPSMQLEVALMMQQQQRRQQMKQQALEGAGPSAGFKRPRSPNSADIDQPVDKRLAMRHLSSSDDIKKEHPGAIRQKHALSSRNSNNFDLVPAITVRYDKETLGFDYAEELRELQQLAGFTERHGVFCMAITKALSSQLCQHYSGKTFAEIVQKLENWDELPSPAQVKFVSKNRKGDGWYFRPSTLNCKYQCGDCRFEAVFACDVFHRLFHFRGDIQLRNTSAFIPPSTPQVTFRF